ncbi:MAG: FAD-dependent oxidoreductase [Saprospiraceae bacterium]
MSQLFKKMQSKIIILGAGLSGLTLAYYLQKENIPFLILEARNRVGGRINTLYGDGGKSVEMGATWFGKKHQHLNELLQELNIGHFPQHTSGVSLFETFFLRRHKNLPSLMERKNSLIALWEGLVI